MRLRLSTTRRRRRDRKGTGQAVSGAVIQTRESGVIVIQQGAIGLEGKLSQGASATSVERIIRGNAKRGREFATRVDSQGTSLQIAQTRSNRTRISRRDASVVERRTT